MQSVAEGLETEDLDDVYMHQMLMEMYKPIANFGRFQDLDHGSTKVY